MYGPHLPSKTQIEKYKIELIEEPELKEDEYLKLIYNDYNGSMFNSVSVQSVKYTDLYQLYIQFFNKVNSKVFNRFYEKIGARFIRTNLHHGREINEWHKKVTAVKQDE